MRSNGKKITYRPKPHECAAGEERMVIFPAMDTTFVSKWKKNSQQFFNDNIDALKHYLKDARICLSIGYTFTKKSKIADVLWNKLKENKKLILVIFHKYANGVKRDCFYDYFKFEKKYGKEVVSAYNRIMCYENTFEMDSFQEHVMNNYLKWMEGNTNGK